ncbi:hypothetical protein C2G38_2214135 [Gigaspora rosea]|uniref:Uncharacterized protein n=1 Tax=Gigaspora rosea TaxID=44941 RepID=A0A397UD41_9GLOM|nr:hypothetical protein C2G38_2214135 [Gigaspora rosea]
MDLKAPNSKFSSTITKYQSEVIELSNTDDELIPANSSEIMSYNNEDINSVASDSLESEIVVLNSSLKNNIINSSFETNNESDLYNLPTFAQFGQNLSVDQIEYFLEFQEYPKTSSTGVASVYNVSGWKPDDAKKAFGIANLQYSYRNPGTIQSIKKCLFLGSQLYKKIFDANESSINTITLNTFGQAYNTPCLYINPVTNIQCNSKPVLREHKKIDNTISTIRKFIGNGINREKRKIINKGNCPIKFYHILLDNLTECPFIVMISTGVHNHPPPPPVKTPQNIMENLQKIINNEYDLDLTARPMVKMYLQGKPLSSIHPSLNNQSRLNYLIEKISDLNIHLDKILLQKNLPDPYIRMARFFDNGQYLVLCTQKEQTKFFAQSLYAKIDMAFK